MESPDRKNRSKRDDDDVIRGSNGFMPMPMNPYFMPMYYPQYMPPMGPPMGYGMHSNRASQELDAHGRPLYQPMPYMPYQPMGMPGFYQQPAPQFTYSRSYFHPNEDTHDKKKKKKKKYDRDYEDDDDSDENYEKPKKPKTFKTSDQIVQEFKSQILPKLRLKRLTKIQAIWRGWFVRNKVIPKKRILFKLCNEITERKIDEFLEVKQLNPM